MIYRISTRLLLGAALVGVVACADSTAPTAGVTESMLTGDVANDITHGTVLTLAQLPDIEGLVGMPLTSSAMSAASGLGSCAWSWGGMSYTCPAVTTPDGLKLERVVGFYSGGTLQQTYDPLTTDSLFFGAWLSGTVTEPDRTIWIKHAPMMMVTGLTGTETQRTFRGEASRDDSARVTSGTLVRTTHLQSLDQINNLVMKLPRVDFPFPQSGTITSHVEVSATTPNGTDATNRSGSRDVTITFNGTRTAAVTIGTTACSLDLVTRKVSCP